MPFEPFDEVIWLAIWAESLLPDIDVAGFSFFTESNLRSTALEDLAQRFHYTRQH